MKEYLQEEIEDILISINKATRMTNGQFLSNGDILMAIGSDKFHIYCPKYSKKKIDDLFKDATNIVIHKGGKIKAL